MSISQCSSRRNSKISNNLISSSGLACAFSARAAVKKPRLNSHAPRPSVGEMSVMSSCSESGILADCEIPGPDSSELELKRQLIEELKDQVLQNTSAIEDSKKYINQLKCLLDDANAERLALEERLLEREKITDELEANVRKLTRQNCDLQSNFEIERSALIREKEDAESREENLRNSLNRIKSTFSLKLRCSNIDTTSSRNLQCRDTIASDPYERKLQSGFAPSSSSSSSSSEVSSNDSTTTSRSSQLLESTRHELSTVKKQLDSALSENKKLIDLRLALSDSKSKLENAHRRIEELTALNERLMEESERSKTFFGHAHVLEDAMNRRFQVKDRLEENDSAYGKCDDEIATLSSELGQTSLAEELECLDSDLGDDEQVHLSQSTDEPNQPTTQQKDIAQENQQLKEDNKALLEYIDDILSRLLDHNAYEVLNKNPTDCCTSGSKTTSENGFMTPPRALKLKRSIKFSTLLNGSRKQSMKDMGGRLSRPQSVSGVSRAQVSTVTNTIIAPMISIPRHRSIFSQVGVDSSRKNTFGWSQPTMSTIMNSTTLSSQSNNMEDYEEDDGGPQSTNVGLTARRGTSPSLSIETLNNRTTGLEECENGPPRWTKGNVFDISSSPSVKSANSFTSSYSSSTCSSSLSSTSSVDGSSSVRSSPRMKSVGGCSTWTPADKLYSPPVVAGNKMRPLILANEVRKASSPAANLLRTQSVSASSQLSNSRGSWMTDLLHRATNVAANAASSLKSTSGSQMGLSSTPKHLLATVTSAPFVTTISSPAVLNGTRDEEDKRGLSSVLTSVKSTSTMTTATTTAWASAIEDEKKEREIH